MEGFLAGQIELNLFFQSLGLWLLEPMRAFTFLGSEQFFILIMPIVLWCIDYPLGLRIGLLLITSGQVNGIFKVLFHSPRPFWFDNRVAALSVENSFGIPSGHAMNTSSLFGMFAIGMHKRWIKIVSVILIVMVGISRLYLGMHFLSDVIGGWILGGILLLLFIKLDKPVTTWFINKPVNTQNLTIILTSLAWIGIGLVPNLLLSQFVMPPEWITNAIHTNPEAIPQPLEISGTFTFAGIWMGLGIGAIWMRRRGGMDAKGVGAQQLFRFIIGIAGTFVLWMGLDLLFPGGESVLALILRIIRYGLVGFWVSGGAPAVFRKLKIANPAMHEAQL